MMISIFPLHGVGSLSTSTMVHWEGVRLLLDCGPGTITEIWRRGLRLRGLSAILLSHAHLDHLWGLPPLLWFLNQRDWNHELLLVFPQEIGPTVQQMYQISGEPGFIKLHPLPSGKKPVKIGKLTIRAFEVNHPSPSCGFTISESPKRRLNTAKLEADGIPKKKWSDLAQEKSVRLRSKTIRSHEYLLPSRSRTIVYTGDTGPAPHLEDEVREADLLIIDASWIHPQWIPAKEAPHLTLRQAFEVFHHGQVKRVLLTHLTTRVSKNNYVKAIEELKKEFNSKIPVFLPTEEKIEFR